MLGLGLGLGVNKIKSISAGGIETPDQVSDMIFWYEFDQNLVKNSSAVDISEGEAIQTVLDKSINGFDLTALTALKPVWSANTLNGQPGVTFAASPRALVNNDVLFNYTQPSTIIIYFKYNSNTTNNYIIDGAYTDGRHVIYAPSTTFYNQFSGTNLASSTPRDFTNPHMMTAIFNTTSSVLRLDGSVILTGDTGAAPMKGITLGGRFSINESSQISFTFIAGWNKVLTAEELTAMELYVSNKYGI